jgi:hypothetical protein
MRFRAAQKRSCALRSRPHAPLCLGEVLVAMQRLTLGNAARQNRVVPATRATRGMLGRHRNPLLLSYSTPKLTLGSHRARERALAAVCSSRTKPGDLPIESAAVAMLGWHEGPYGPIECVMIASVAASGPNS